MTDEENQPTSTKRKGGFAEFFLRASDCEKREVLMKAAQEANKLQRELVSKVR